MNASAERIGGGEAASCLTKHDTISMRLHWANAIGWAILLATGLGLLVGSPYRLVWEGWPLLMTRLVGGREALKLAHSIVGLIWFIEVVILAVVGWRQSSEFIRYGLRIDEDDILWLKARARGIMGRHTPLPPQDQYNGGQKLFAWLALVGTAGIGISGVILFFGRWFPLGLVQWALPVHVGFVGLVSMGLVVHLFMSLLLKEERPALGSMFTGMIDAGFARTHHRKWYDRMVGAGRATTMGEQIGTPGPAPSSGEK